MAKKEVSFSTSISPVDGDLIDVLVYLQGFKQHTWHENGAVKVKTDGVISSGRVLEVTYTISAPNGTKYKIEYECTGDCQKAFDLLNPSPIEKLVTGGNYAKQIIKIRF